MIDRHIRLPESHAGQRTAPHAPAYWFAALALLLGGALACVPPARAAGGDDPALKKIVDTYEAHYGPLPLFWADRVQMAFAANLIGNAQVDGKITPGEGRVVQRAKEDLGPTADAGLALHAAQESWLGHQCDFKGDGCLASTAYKVKEPYPVEKRQ